MEFEPIPKRQRVMIECDGFQKQSDVHKGEATVGQPLLGVTVDRLQGHSVVLLSLHGIQVVVLNVPLGCDNMKKMVGKQDSSFYTNSGYLQKLSGIDQYIDIKIINLLVHLKQTMQLQKYCNKKDNIHHHHQKTTLSTHILSNRHQKQPHQMEGSAEVQIISAPLVHPFHPIQCASLSSRFTAITSQLVLLAICMGAPQEFSLCCVEIAFSKVHMCGST